MRIPMKGRKTLVNELH